MGKYLIVGLSLLLVGCAGSPGITASCDQSSAHGGGNASIIRQSCVTIVNVNSPPTNTVTTTVTIPTSSGGLPISSLTTNGSAANLTGVP